MVQRSEASLEQRRAYARNFGAMYPERKKVYTDRHRYNGLALITAIKIERGCVECGYNDYPEALEFDHIGNDKTYNVSQMSSMKEERMWQEVAKCEVVCANCHAHRTLQRRNTK